MKLINRIIAAAAALTLSLPAAAVYSGVQASAASGGILILGDSISSGESLKENEPGYFDYLAAATGKPITNLAVSGAITTELIEVIDNPNNADVIASSDIICISIGGNDLIRPTKALLATYQQEGETTTQTVKRLLKEADIVQLMSDLTGALRQPRTTARDNYAVIEQKLRALNPDAEIVMQTIYNPMEVSDAFLAENNISDTNLDNYQKAVSYIASNEKTLNKAILALETVKVADVSETFTGSTWIYSRVLDEQDIHPNAVGHAMIGALILDALGIAGGADAKMSLAVRNMKLASYYEMPQEHMDLLMKYAAPPEFVFGDQDGDGIVGLEDAQNVLNLYAQTLTGEKPENIFSYGTMMCCDVNSDSAITVEDSQFILNYYAETTLSGNDVTWFDITQNPNAPGAP